MTQDATLDRVTPPSAQEPLPVVVIVSVLAVPLIELVFERGAFDHTATLNVARVLLPNMLGVILLAWIFLPFGAKLFTRSTFFEIQAPLVVADSFQRIFQENMVYSGMPFTTDRSVLTTLEQGGEVDVRALLGQGPAGGPPPVERRAGREGEGGAR